MLRRQVGVEQPGDLGWRKPQILQRQDAMESGQLADRVVYGRQKKEEAREYGGRMGAHGDLLRQLDGEVPLQAEPWARGR